VVAPESDTNADFYGHDVSVKQILANGVRNPASRRLQANLNAAF
jgi:hypothetical protein